MLVLVFMLIVICVIMLDSVLSVIWGTMLILTLPVRSNHPVLLVIVWSVPILMVVYVSLVILTSPWLMILSAALLLLPALNLTKYSMELPVDVLMHTLIMELLVWLVRLTVLHVHQLLFVLLVYLHLSLSMLLVRPVPPIARLVRLLLFVRFAIVVFQLIVVIYVSIVLLLLYQLLMLEMLLLSVLQVVPAVLQLLFVRLVFRVIVFSSTPVYFVINPVKLVQRSTLPNVYLATQV